jgi:predicted metal-dependent peptidase
MKSYKKLQSSWNYRCNITFYVFLFQHNDTDVEYLNGQNVQDTEQHRYKRNAANFSFQLPKAKVQSTTVKTTTKSNVPLKINPSVSRHNTNSSKQLNQTILNKNMTKIENETETFIDVFKARTELLKNKTSNAVIYILYILYSLCYNSALAIVCASIHF